MPIAFYYPEHWNAVLAAPRPSASERLDALLKKL